MSVNTVCWADIPVRNLDRAIAFYSAVLGAEVTREGEGDFIFGLLPHSEQNASGCLVEMENNSPAQNGPLVYLSVEGRLDAAISQTEKHGGKIVTAKHEMGLTASARLLAIEREIGSRFIRTTLKTG